MILGVLTLVLLASCSKNGSDPDTITQQAITNCFTYYTNSATVSSQAGQSSSYVIELNYTKMTGTVSMIGISTPDGTAYPTMIAKNIPMKVDGATINLSAATVQSTVEGFATSPLLTDFHMTIVNRAIGEQYVPGFLLDFKLGAYSVFSSMPYQYYYGTTTSVDQAGVPFSSDNVSYELTLSSDLKTATLNMNGAQFIAAMPAMNISLPNLPVTVVGTELVIQADAVTPSINNTPFPNFPITDFRATVNLASNAIISFKCKPGTMPGEYTVTAQTSLDSKGN